MSMKVIVEFDLDDDMDRYRYEQFQNMERNARFWNDLYDDVFRKVIRYEHSAPRKQKLYQKVWDEIGKYMEELEEE